RPSRDLPGAGHSLVSDPESAAPEPIPVVEGDGAAAALEPVHARVPAWALALNVVLPGAGQVVAGSVARGMLFLLPWAFLLACLYIGWGALGRIAARANHPGAGDWVAVAGLAATMVLVWAAALADLLAARRRAERGAQPRGDAQWRIAARHFKKSRLATAGVFVIFVLYAVAILAPLLAPYDPIAQPTNLIASSYLSPFSAGHLLGTDQFGRDVLSRILYGARISLAIGFVATAIAVTLGTLIGAVAGYLGGWVDAALMRFTDMVLAFPRLVLLILVVALFSPSLTLIILVLGLTQWPGTTRIVRGDVLSLREREYIQAARALGFGRWRIIFRHLVPNVLAPVIVTATLGIGNTIVMEAGLSFLGLGVQPPTPSWGSMVSDGRQNLIGAWWVATFPGLVIVLTVLAFNLVGDALRDALDPRLRT
ncbi:MAG TPA: oligopeptide ABC transporter permease, partial [Longimicrobiales bacterium]